MSNTASASSSSPSRNPIESLGEDHPILGEEVFVHSSAAVIGKVILGDRVSIWPQVTLRADEGEIKIGSDSNIQDGSTVHMTGGYSETMIGERVTVGHMCLLHGCTVEDDCLIGMGTILLDRCVIGAGSYVAAGTMITGNKVIPPRSFVMGRPGQLIVKPLSDQRAQEMAYSWRHYLELSRRYLSSLATPLSLLVSTCLWTLGGTGCAPIERADLINSPQLQRVTLKSLERQRFDGMLFSETEYDPFSHQRGVLALTKTPPVTINYHTFGAPRLDALIHEAYALYARYRFALNAVDRLKRELTTAYGEDALSLSPDELHQLMYGEQSGDKSQQPIDMSGRGDSTPPQADHTQTAQETDISESLNVSPSLTRGSKAVRLVIATHRELVTQTMMTHSRLHQSGALIEGEIERDLNLSRLRTEMMNEAEEARQIMSTLLAGLPHLSKAIKEVDQVTAVIP